MNSPFVNLFLSIRQQIIDNVPDIVYVDQDFGQLNGNKAGMRPAVNFPCILIDFEDFNYKNLSNNVQTVFGIVVLKLGFAPHSPSMQTTPDAYLKKAINFYDLEYSINEILQGWFAGDAFGSLYRENVITQKRNDTIRVREIRYSIAFEDYSTQYKAKMQNVLAEITEEIVL